MKNAHITDLLNDYIDGTLSSSAQERVKSHLIFCNPCRQHLTDLERNVSLLKSTPPARVPAGLKQRVLARAAAELKKPSDIPAESAPQTSWTWTFRGLALAAACGVVVFALRQMPSSLRKAPVDTLGKQEFADGAQRKESRSRLAELDRDERAGDDLTVPAEKPAAPTAPPSTKSRFDKPDQLKKLQANRDEEMNYRENESQEAAAKDKNDWLLDDAKKAEVEEKAKRRQNIRAASGHAGELGRAQGAASYNSGASAPSARSESNLGSFSGQQSGISQSLQKVISSQSAWEDLWNKHTRSQNPQPALPFVDFKTSDVIAVFLGSRPSAGHSVTILSVDRSTWEGKPARIVRVKIQTPPEGAMTAAVMTQPFALKIVPKFTGPTFFQNSR